MFNLCFLNPPEFLDHLHSESSVSTRAFGRVESDSVAIADGTLSFVADHHRRKQQSTADRPVVDHSSSRTVGQWTFGILVSQWFDHHTQQRTSDCRR